MRAALVVGALVASGVLSGGQAYAQIDFSGAWTLDREISGDLARATFEPPESPARRSGGFGGGYGGRGGPGRRGGGARRGSTGADDNGRRGEPLTPDERLRVRGLAEFVKTLSSIVIDHSDRATLTLTDPAGRSRLFPTDGTPTTQTFGTATIASVTTWDGPHLVTAYRIGASRDLLVTYILVPATRQMAVRIALDESGRPRADVPELRLVYKLKTTSNATPKSD